MPRRSLEIFGDGRVYEIKDDLAVKVTETNRQVKALIEALKFSVAKTYNIHPPDEQPPDVAERRGSKHINGEGFKLLTRFEECELTAYDDGGGVWTIGYGHTGDDVYPGLMLLYNDRFNNPNPVAPPGASNHQTGLAIDIEDATGWEVYLMRYGRNPLPGDPPHFDYQGDGTIDLRSQSILAFQQLWNQNHPDQRITEDGGFGPHTEDALNRSPDPGFPQAPWDEKPRTLRLAIPRMEGSDVLKLQEGLKKAGIVVGTDGEFGPGTDKAVKEFQQQKGLKPDGIVGTGTRQQLG